MWPFRRPPAKEVLRIGRYRIERWISVGNSLTPQAEFTLPGNGAPDPIDIIPALSELYATTAKVATTVLLESCWLPVLSLNVGDGLLRSSQLDLLARHRLSLLYSDSTEPVADWELRISYRAGDRQALVYGLPPRLKKILVSCAESRKQNWSSILPACAWGWNWMRAAKGWPHPNGWSVWPEQDRTLLTYIEAGAIVDLHAAAPPSLESWEIVEQIEAQHVRLGRKLNEEPIAVATWDDIKRTSQPSSQFRWYSVRGQHSAARTVGTGRRQAA